MKICSKYFLLYSLWKPRAKLKSLTEMHEICVARYLLTYVKKVFATIFKNFFCANSTNIVANIKLCVPSAILWFYFSPGTCTVVVLTNFTIFPHYLQAFRKKTRQMKEVHFCCCALPWFDEFFLIICEYQKIVKFVKTMSECTTILTSAAAC